MADRRSNSNLSCAECRRSKLKCDRNWPCQSCVRRGCEYLCPNDTMPASKGSKAIDEKNRELNIKVRTQDDVITKLRDDLTQARDRIMNLEGKQQDLTNAIARSNAQVMDGTHPYLPSNMKKPEPSKKPDVEPDDVDSTANTMSTLSIASNGWIHYQGSPASSKLTQYLQELLSPATGGDIAQPTSPRASGLPPGIIELIISFPFGLRNSPYDKNMLLEFIPERRQALRLVEIYYREISWICDPIAHHDFTTTIFNQIYPYPDTAGGYFTLSTIDAHRLSVFFIILATATLHESSEALRLAEHYQMLSRAAVSIEALTEAPTCFTVIALLMMYVFPHWSGQSGHEERWLLLGMACKVAQRIGLQRDSAGSGASLEEVQRRRIAFWELFRFDAWASILNGRAPSLSVRHTDCKFPEDKETTRKPSGEIEIGWRTWTTDYSVQCLGISVQHVFVTRVPAYQSLLDLDRKIRGFAVPSFLEAPVGEKAVGRSWSSDPAKAMQQYHAIAQRELNLLCIHRSYFAMAMRDKNPLEHKYAESVYAAVSSARMIISSFRSMYQVHPDMASRVWQFWYCVFSSCVILGALVIECPGCKLAPVALQELENALPFYDSGSRACRPSATYQPILQGLRDRAASALAFHEGAGAPSEHQSGEASSSSSSAYSGPSRDPSSPSYETYQDQVDANGQTGAVGHALLQGVWTPYDSQTNDVNVIPQHRPIETVGNQHVHQAMYDAPPSEYQPHTSSSQVPSMNRAMNGGMAPTYYGNGAERFHPTDHAPAAFYQFHHGGQYPIHEPPMELGHAHAQPLSPHYLPTYNQRTGLYHHHVPLQETSHTLDSAIQSHHLQQHYNPGQNQGQIWSTFVHGLGLPH